MQRAESVDGACSASGLKRGFWDESGPNRDADSARCMVGFTSMPLSCCDLQPGRSCLSSKRTLIYKVSMEEARWGAVCPDTFPAFAHDSRQVLTFQGKSCSTFHVIYQEILELSSNCGVVLRLTTRLCGLTREGTALFRYRQQNDKYGHVQEGKKDQQPHEPGKFSLEFPLFAHMISFRRTFGGYKTHSNAQARWRTYGGAAHFHEQRLVARFAEHPFVTRFWRFNRLFVRNGVKPDKARTDRTAYGFVPAPSLSCFSPGGDRSIISWHHHFGRSLSFPVALPGFSRKQISSLFALHAAVQHKYCTI
jgi:hypothetical protein